MDFFFDVFYKYGLGSMEMLIGFHFFTRCLGKKARSIDYLLFAAAGILIMAICPSESIIEFFAYALLLVIVGITICKANGMLSLLYAVVIIEIMQLCYGIFNSLSCILSPILFSHSPEMIGIFFVVFNSIMAPLFSIACYRVVYEYFSHEEIRKVKYALMILTPALMIFLASRYISFNIYGSTIIIEEGGNISNVDHYLMFMIQLLGIVSLFCIMSAYRKLVENFDLSMELSLLEQETYFLHQYVEEAKMRYEKTKSFRHDIKNHIVIVKELIRNGRAEQALHYIGDMEHMTSDLSFPCNTNNPALDILIGNKLGVAENDGIDVLCNLHVPCPCAISDIDFCIILSNALDNAIHACVRMDKNERRYIRVTGKVQGDFILLEIENSCTGEGTLRKGTGLSNIKAVAEKYHGAVNVNSQGISFSLTILLIIPQQ